ncbi:hypothetical protein Ciccas_009106 [Cichlidogyrus casuarinus]|uniref:Uncharacterized protein n=1 Tax=Cichlidogyrus casuarinus TaxID=1844966 RepID=A0ABD2PY10_9PLAT
MEPDKETQVILVNNSALNVKSGIYSSANAAPTSLSNPSYQVPNETGVNFMKQVPVNLLYTSQGISHSFSNDSPVKDQFCVQSSHPVTEFTFASSLPTHVNGVANGCQIADDTQMFKSDSSVRQCYELYDKNDLNGPVMTAKHQNMSLLPQNPPTHVVSSGASLLSNPQRNFVQSNHRIVFDRIPNNNGLQFVQSVPPFHYATTPQGALIQVLPENCHNSLQQPGSTIRFPNQQPVILRPGGIIQTVPSAGIQSGIGQMQQQCRGTSEEQEKTPPMNGITMSQAYLPIQTAPSEVYSNGLDTMQSAPKAPAKKRVSPNNSSQTGSSTASKRRKTSNYDPQAPDSATSQVCEPDHTATPLGVRCCAVIKEILGFPVFPSVLIE